jgi:uncharacterized RDD family membrane protein YckC
MTSVPLSAPPPPAISTSPIAGFWRRITALAVDLLILGVPTLLLGLALFRWAEGLGQAGRLVGFVVALLYFGLLNSVFAGGQTLGKRMLGIRVTDRSGNTLAPMRSVSRFLVIAIPYFLNGLWFDADPASLRLPEYLLVALIVFVVFGGLGAIAYLFVFNRRTRQSLHDLAVGSFVVRGAPTAVPDGLSTARLHRIVVGCWLVLIGIGLMLPLILPLQKTRVVESLKPLSELQSAIKTQLGLQQVKVTMGSTSNITVRTGASTTTFLQVEARADASQNDLDALGRLVAGMVLDHYPDLLGKQVLIVYVLHGFDLGIASWTIGHRETLDGAAWREKLGRSRSQPTKI